MMLNKITVNNHEYDLVIDEIENPNCEYAMIPLVSDIIIYGISTVENDLIFKNTDDTGLFFVPYVYCKNRSAMLGRIESLVEGCEAKIRLMFKKQHIPSGYKTRVVVKKYVEKESNKRFVAIYAVNANKKTQEIVDLNIQTSFTECKSHDNNSVWLDTINEMTSDPKICYGCVIDKSEVMEFESRTVAVENMRINDTHGSDVLILQSNENLAFAKHHHNTIFANSFRDWKSKKSGYVYNMPKYRVQKYSEINLLAKRLIETFRTLTGSYRCKTTILYNDISVNAYDVSMATYAIAANTVTTQEDKSEE